MTDGRYGFVNYRRSTQVKDNKTMKPTTEKKHTIDEVNRVWLHMIKKYGVAWMEYEKNLEYSDYIDAAARFEDEHI